MDGTGMERPLKSDLVERRLLEMIQTGELEPGSPLHQRRIAQQLGVSPTPVREAFRRLEVAGLVVFNSHTGVRVAEPLRPTDPDAMKVRAVVENLGIELAMQRITPEDVAELRRLNEAFGAAETEDDAREWHRRLHYRVYETAGSPALLAQMRLLWGMIQMRSFHPRGRADSVAHHNLLIDAIAS
ncbi:MAG TPA: GntR family transcriptional regulator, partial [Acidimicrobiia bacterium]|nr:GntR family transcriptional regulator [Acidimicrobiia bacterium]